MPFRTTKASKISLIPAHSQADRRALYLPASSSVTRVRPPGSAIGSSKARDP
jgi:hypothetical protein